MANDDEDDEPAWDPKDEKRSTDPREIARAYAQEIGKIVKEQQRESTPSYRVGAAHATPPDLQLAIHPIREGFLVVHARVPASEYGGPPPYLPGKVEEFAADQAAVHAILLRVLREFFAMPAPGTPVPPSLGVYDGDGPPTA